MMVVLFEKKERWGKEVLIKSKENWVPPVVSSLQISQSYQVAVQNTRGQSNLSYQPPSKSKICTTSFVVIDFLNYIWSFILFKIFIQICKIISYV
jgi:hypothetical protein